MSASPHVLRVLPGAGRNQSLDRAFGLLERLALHPAGATVATITRELGLPRATVTRLLASLADAGAVTRNGRAWTIGPSIERLGRATAIGAIRNRARPLMQEVVSAIQETVLLAVPIGNASAQVIEEIQGPRIVTARGWAGTVLSAPASGFVRQLLAELPEPELHDLMKSLMIPASTARTITRPDKFIKEIARIRNEGYAVVIDEYEMGLAGLGVPVRENGRLVAMIATHMPSTRFNDEMRTQALSRLRGAADRLGHTLSAS